jgi:hypothetical protein
MPVQLLVLAGLVRIARTGSMRVVAATALGMGWLLILHPISVVFVVFVAPGLLFAVRRPWSGANLARAAGSGLWGAAVAAFWLVPAVEHRALRGQLSAFDTPSLLGRLSDVAGGEIVYPQVLGAAVVIGCAVALGMATRPGAERRWLAAPGTAVVYLLLGHLAVSQGWGPTELWVQLPNRGLALAGCLLLLPLAVVVADAIGRLRAPLDLRVTAVAVIGLALLAPVVLTGLLDPRQSAPATSPDLQAVARLLKAEALPPARHLLVEPSPFVPLGTSAPARWLTSASGSPTAELYFAEATRNPGAGVLPGEVLDERSPEDALGPLRRAGITHLIATTPIPAQLLDGQPGYRLIETDGTLAVFTIEPGRGAPDVRDLLQPDGDALRPDGAVLDAELVHADAEHDRWAVGTGGPAAGPETAVVAPVAFDPGWHATVDGRPVEVTASSEGLVRFTLPEGARRAELQFTGAPTPWLAIAVSLLATGAAVVVLLRGLDPRRRIRRRPVAGTVDTMDAQPGPRADAGA